MEESYKEEIDIKTLEILKKYGRVAGKSVLQEALPQCFLELFSPLRSNCIRWLEITETDEILEIGSKTGAVTEYLASVSGHVTCLEASAIANAIHRERMENPEKITLMDGSIVKNLETLPPKKYHYIMLWDRLQIFQDKNLTENLEVLLSYLAPDGKLILGTDNKYGLKFWNGCKEMGQNEFFTMMRGKGTLHYSKKQLEKAVTALNRPYWLYYPYPDYQYATALYSDEWMPKKGELVNNHYPQEDERLHLFEENEVYDQLIGDEMYPAFANSYLVVIEGV